MWEKEKRRTLVIIIRQTLHSKRNATVAGELRRQLNDTDVDPWLVNGGECEIYDDVIFL